MLQLKTKTLLMNPQLKAATFLSHSVTSFPPAHRRRSRAHTAAKKLTEKTMTTHRAPEDGSLGSAAQPFFFFPIRNEIGDLITCLNQANLIS